MRFGGVEFLARHREQTQCLLGEARQLGRAVGRRGRGESTAVETCLRSRIVVDELAVLVEADSTYVDGVGLAGIRLGFTLGFGLGLDEVLGQYLPQHQVRVRSAESETRHSGDRVAAVSGPIGHAVGDAESHGIEVDVGIGAGVVDRRGNLVVRQ